MHKVQSTAVIAVKICKKVENLCQRFGVKTNKLADASKCKLLILICSMSV